MDLMEILPSVLLVLLALVMLGLGLSLKVEDFLRIGQNRNAVVLALVLQVVLLPIVAFGIAFGFALPAAFAVGLLILAASPGGVTANLFSHVFGGKVAMNVTLTAINTVIAIVSLPLISNLAISVFQPGGGDGAVVPMQFGKVAQVVAVVLVPVVLGMAVGAKAPDFAKRSEKPFKILSALVLAAFALIAILQERQALFDSFTTLGLRWWCSTSSACLQVTTFHAEPAWMIQRRGRSASRSASTIPPWRFMSRCPCSAISRLLCQRRFIPSRCM